MAMPAKKFALNFNTDPELFYKIQEWRQNDIPGKVQNIYAVLKEKEGLDITYQQTYYWIRKAESEQIEDVLIV